MNRPQWHDAEEARRWLQDRPRCRSVLYLLARLPFLDIRILHQLAGQHGPAAMYHSVARLQESGLIASIQPPIYGHNSPQLFYLTDLGVTTVALDLRSDPRHLAQRFHLRAVDLLKLLPSLRRVLDTYELLGVLATSHASTPTLLAWERPWRRPYARPGGKNTGSVTLPAYAALSWEGMASSYLLLPDAGTIPLRLWRTNLERLHMLRRTYEGRLPLLLISTIDRGHMKAWDHLIHEVARARREAPLAARIVRWDDLTRGPVDLPVGGDDPLEATLVRSIRLAPLRPRRPNTPIPRIVGSALAVPTLSGSKQLGEVALVVTPTDYRLLEFIGFHPYLTACQLSDVFGCGIAPVRQRVNRFVELGLARHLRADEVGEETASQELPELTICGLKLVAAHLGLSLATAVRELGLVGGGPDNPVGSRRKLLRNLAHTRGADDIFIRLYRHARERTALGCDEAMVEWQNAAACSRRHLRPDGYGVYRSGSRYDGFFLEYDRGTMNSRDYFKKFGAYYRYGETGRFERDYNTYPTVLVVTSNNTAEERIARVARSVAIGQAGKLPLLLTCHWRIKHSGNPAGFLGSVWRPPDSNFDHRFPWPLVTDSAGEHGPLRTGSPLKVLH